MVIMSKITIDNEQYVSGNVPVYDYSVSVDIGTDGSVDDLGLVFDAQFGYGSALFAGEQIVGR